MSKKQRSAFLAVLVVLSVLSLATMGCGGTDGNGGSFLEGAQEFAEEVVEGEKQNWSEISGSVTENPGKNTGFVGGAGKLLCESTGGRWVASIDACYKK